MSDMLTKLYDAWAAKLATKDPTTFQAFQAGLTAGAVSMRTRAMKACHTGGKPVSSGELVNQITNAIGQLPDIPTE